MATFSKVLLSGSTNGRNIKVAATASLGTLIHTAHASALDELTLFATNNDSSDRLLTIEWGGTTSTDDLVKVTVPYQTGWMIIIPGLVLTGGVAVRAYVTGAANVVNINGYVNRIS